MSNNSIKIKIELDHIVFTKDELKSIKKQIFKNFPDISIKQAIDEILKHGFSIFRSALYRQAILKALEEWSGEEIIFYQITREKKLRRIKSEREIISLLSPSAAAHLKTADQFRDQLNQVRSFGKRHLRRCRQEYKETKNPLFVWDVYYLCQQLEIPVPKWVNVYLTESASKILEVSRQWTKNDRTSRKLPKSLGFIAKGGTSFFEQYNLSLRDQHFYLSILKVKDEMPPGGKAGTKIILALLEKEGVILGRKNYERICGKNKDKDFFLIPDEDDDEDDIVFDGFADDDDITDD